MRGNARLANGSVAAASRVSGAVDLATRGVTKGPRQPTTFHLPNGATRPPPPLPEGTTLPNGEKVFICPVCNREFNKKANLKVHSRKHTGERPYQCSKPGCGKRFMWKSSLSFHEQNCTAKIAANETIPRSKSDAMKNASVQVPLPPQALSQAPMSQGAQAAQQQKIGHPPTMNHSVYPKSQIASDSPVSSHSLPSAEHNSMPPQVHQVPPLQQMQHLPPMQSVPPVQALQSQQSLQTPQQHLHAPQQHLHAQQQHFQAPQQSLQATQQLSQLQDPMQSTQLSQPSHPDKLHHDPPIFASRANPSSPLPPLQSFAQSNPVSLRRHQPSSSSSSLPLPRIRPPQSPYTPPTTSVPPLYSSSASLPPPTPPPPSSSQNPTNAPLPPPASFGIRPPFARPPPPPPISSSHANVPVFVQHYENSNTPYDYKTKTNRQPGAPHKMPIRMDNDSDDEDNHPRLTHTAGAQSTFLATGNMLGYAPLTRCSPMPTSSPIAYPQLSPMPISPLAPFSPLPPMHPESPQHFAPTPTPVHPPLTGGSTRSQW